MDNEDNVSREENKREKSIQSSNYSIGQNVETWIREYIKSYIKFIVDKGAQ